MDRVNFSVINLLQTEAGFATSQRIFDYDYLLYVHQGKGTYQIGDQVYRAAVGDLFYCPPGIGNTIRSDRKDPFLLSGIEFTAPAFREQLPRRTSLLSHRFLIDGVMEMVHEYQYGRTGSKEICDALLSALLRNLTRMKNSPVQGRDTAEELLAYLGEHYHQKITHQELEKVFCYHKNTINRMLESKTGLSLTNYLITLRLRKAAELLKYTDRSVSEIADFCGYSSVIFFSRQFREKVGLSPGAFRKKHGSAEETEIRKENRPDGG